MGDGLGRIYAHCDGDDDVRAVVVTGAGDAFCAGADLAPEGDTFAAPDGQATEAAPAFTSSPVRPPAWEVRKPVIAAMNGHAIGIGMSLAMQCDLRFMATGAKYGFVHNRRGVLPDAHSHWTVPRAVGFARAADLLAVGTALHRRGGRRDGARGAARSPPDEVLAAALDVRRTTSADQHRAAVGRALEAAAVAPAGAGRRRVRPARDRVPRGRHGPVPTRAKACSRSSSAVSRAWTLSPTRDWPPS